MTRQVFRDKLGRFTTKNKAETVQTVDKDEWKKPRDIGEFEEIEEQYEEYEYFVGFDYQTPRVTIGGKAFLFTKQVSTGQRGLHNFKTEFRVKSPTKLTQHELREAIKDEFSSGNKNYRNVLNNQEAYQYEIKDTVKRKVKEPSSLDVDMTSTIER